MARPIWAVWHGFTRAVGLGRPYGVAAAEERRFGGAINSSVVTSGISPNHYSMTFYAYNTSVVDFESSTLTTAGGSWVLGNFYDQSQLIANSSIFLPTEIYPSDSSRISVSNSVLATLYIDFISGSKGTINVPRYDARGNFNFVFGNSPGFNYSINVIASKTRLGLESHQIQP